METKKLNVGNFFICQSNRNAVDQHGVRAVRLGVSYADLFDADVTTLCLSTHAQSRSTHKITRVTPIILSVDHYIDKLSNSCRTAKQQVRLGKR